MRTLTFLLWFISASSLAAQQSLEEQGKNYALLFYVDKYIPGWPQLPESGKEAHAIQTELEEQYNYIGELVNNPTQTVIMYKCRQYVRKLKKQDRLLIFFSMQGFYDASEEKGYLLPSDAIKKDPQRKTWLKVDDLDMFTYNQVGQVLIILDACFPGRRFDGIGGNPMYAPVDCNERIIRSFNQSTRQYLSTSNKALRPSGESKFAESLLEILQKENRGGVFSAAELAAMLPETVFSDGSWGARESEFLFVRKNACPAMLDNDGDGIPDAKDQCPDTYGKGPNGCPASSIEDKEKQDIDAWALAKATNTDAAYLQYLDHFPNGNFRENAQRALQQQAVQKRDDLSWQWANNKNSRESYLKYLEEHPDGKYRNQAEDRLNSWELVPSFPWPPPECALRRRLENDLTRYKTLGVISRKICDSLDIHGYTQRGFYKAPNGFALVTQMEQFNSDGTSMTGDARWAQYPVRAISDLWSYFKALVLPSNGYFRIFVFVVTDVPYTNTGQTISKDQAVKWVNDGANELSTDIRNVKPNLNHRLDLLIYEFETPNATKICAQKCPCRLSDKVHLASSGLGMLGFN